MTIDHKQILDDILSIIPELDTYNYPNVHREIFDYARWDRNLDVVKYLLNNVPQYLLEECDGELMDMQTFLNKSLDESLTSAAHDGNTVIVKYLLEEGAVARDIPKDYVWLSIAKDKGHTEVVKYFEAKIKETDDGK